MGYPGEPDPTTLGLVLKRLLFLLSDAAAHISGAVLPVDGGSLAGRFTLRPGTSERVTPAN